MAEIEPIKFKHIEDKVEIAKKVSSINKHIEENKFMLIREEKDYIIISDYVDMAMYMFVLDKNQNITRITIMWGNYEIRKVNFG